MLDSTPRDGPVCLGDVNRMVCGRSLAGDSLKRELSNWTLSTCPRLVFLLGAKQDVERERVGRAEETVPWFLASFVWKQSRSRRA